MRASAPSSSSWLREGKKERKKKSKEKNRKSSGGLSVFSLSSVYFAGINQAHTAAEKRRWRRQRFTQLSRLRMYRKEEDDREEKYTKKPRPRPTVSVYIHVCSCSMKCNFVSIPNIFFQLLLLLLCFFPSSLFVLF